ncbi:MAG: 3-phosphoshikimate 1-carboxyvinyltransferase [Lachnospiraceae bacterium]|nr:3-phosphoshikimate 1-carboxyvinyltransferase [Lachnospiraceae bacterium]
MKLSRAMELKGEIKVPGDKSISHRSIMLGAIAEGDTVIRGFLKSADCNSTIKAFKAMGIEIEEEEDKIIVHGKGLHGLRAPASYLDCGNSGTTIRILSGLLSGQPFESVLTGDSSIQKRPMRRVIEPLQQMGAKIESMKGNGSAPLAVHPSSLKGMNLKTKVASAQVKSAILMAGLYADGPVSVREPILSRNHTEIMLKSFGAKISLGTVDDPTTVLEPGNALEAREINVPGDISSAAYFIAAGLITPDSEIMLRNVGINSTRDGILRVLKEMGADISLFDIKETAGEKCADLLIKTSHLKAANIGGEIIPSLIDELPLLAVIATQAEGTTVIKDAAELKVKESDRIALTVNGLKAMGADVTAADDGMIINGPTPLHHAKIATMKDHRIAMSFSIASLINQDVQSVEILDSGSVGISYPMFYRDLDSLK